MFLLAIWLFTKLVEIKLKRIEKKGSCPVLGGKQVMKFANARHRSRVGFILDKRK